MVLSFSVHFNCKKKSYYKNKLKDIFSFPGTGGKQVYESLWIINNFSTSCISWQACEIFIAFVSKGIKVSFSSREYYSMTQCMSHRCLLQLCFHFLPRRLTPVFQCCLGLTSSDNFCCLSFKLLHSTWLLLLWCGLVHIINHRTQTLQYDCLPRTLWTILPSWVLNTTLKKWRMSRQREREIPICVAMCKRSYALEQNGYFYLWKW